MFSTECKSKSANNSTPHSWNVKEFKYKIEDSPESAEVGELDQYVFVVRMRIGEYLILQNIPSLMSYCR
jgi:hypothetical protein